MALYLVAYTIDGQIVLAYNTQDKSFMGGKDSQAVIASLPNYNSYHNRDYTWSMSAAVHYINFSPLVVRFESLDDIDKHVHPDKMVYQKNSFAGSVAYVKLEDNYVPEIIYKAPLVNS